MDIDSLKAELAAEKKDRRKAAEIGKSLLTANEELQSHIEDMRRSHAVEIEDLEQEKHSLASRLAHVTHMETAYSDEIESLQILLRKRAEAEREAEARHAAEFAQLRVELADSNSRLRDAEVAALEGAEERLALVAHIAAFEKNESELCERRASADMSLIRLSACDNEPLYLELEELAAAKAKLSTELGQALNSLELLRAQCERKSALCDTLQADMDGARCQASIYCNALEKQRVENQDLRTELDMARMTNQDHKQKGNSMFAELEDKRVDAEKRLIAMHVENKSLHSQCDEYRQQLRKLKMQMASILQTSSCSVDSSHVVQLEQQLAKATSQLGTLTHQFSELEKSSAKDESNQKLALAVRPALDSIEGAAAQSQAAVIPLGYAQALLKSKDTKVQQLLDELQAKRYELLTEGSRLLDSQHRQREAEVSVARLRAENVRLTVRLEELALKQQRDTTFVTATADSAKLVHGAVEERQKLVGQPNCSIQEAALSAAMKSATHNVASSAAVKPLTHNIASSTVLNPRTAARVALSEMRPLRDDNARTSLPLLQPKLTGRASGNASTLATVRAASNRVTCTTAEVTKNTSKPATSSAQSADENTFSLDQARSGLRVQVEPTLVTPQTGTASKVDEECHTQ